MYILVFMSGRAKYPPGALALAELDRTVRSNGLSVLEALGRCFHSKGHSQLALYGAFWGTSEKIPKKVIRTEICGVFGGTPRKSPKHRLICLIYRVFLAPGQGTRVPQKPI